MSTKVKGYGLSMAECLDELKTKVVDQPIKVKVERELKQVQVVKDGIVSSEWEVVTVDVSERNKGLKVKDFALGNLLAVGATDLLKPVKLTNSNVDGVLDVLDQVGAVLDNIPAESESEDKVEE